MRSLLTAGVVVLLFLAWGGAGRCGDAKDARPIVEKAIQATGGVENLKKHQASTFKEKGTYYGMGEGVPYTASYAMQWPDKFRMEVTGVFAMVLNGDKGWIKMGDQTREMSKEEVAQHQDGYKAGWIASLLPLQDKAFKLTLLGATEVEKQPAVGVQVKRPNYPEVKLYFDNKSGLLVKSEFEAYAQELKKRIHQEMYFQDYKLVEGIQTPTHMILKREGKVFVDAHVSDYKAHSQLDPKLFSMP